MMKGFFQLNQTVSNFLIIVLVSIMLVSTSLQILFRYVLQSPLGWSEEVARFSLVWVTFVGAGLLVLKEEHYSIELLTKRLPKRIQLGCYICASLTMILFGSVMAWGGVKMVSTLYFAKSAALRIPLGFVYVIMPLSGIVIIANSIFIILQTFTGRK